MVAKSRAAPKPGLHRPDRAKSAKEAEETPAVDLADRDLSSSYLKGRCCPLTAFGHNRDGKKGKPQIVFGLLCADNGCPLALEVFSGNTGDPKTVAAQVEKIQRCFGIESITLVGDRGMLTTAPRYGRISRRPVWPGSRP